MSRSKIVILLYVMTFLMSAYVKFTAPHRLDPNYEIQRDDEVLYIGSERINSLNYQWSAPQTKAEFSYSIAKQVGEKIVLGKEFFTDGPGVYSVSYVDTTNIWKAKWMRARSGKNYELLFQVEETGNHFYIQEINKEGKHWQERLFLLQDVDYRLVYSEKEMNDILLFKKVPFANGDISLKYHKIGKDTKIWGNILFCVDKVTVNLVDSTWTINRMVTDDSCMGSNSEKTPFFSIFYNLPETAHELRGNYIDFIEETIKNSNRGRLYYSTRLFRIVEGDIPETFEITYPPESFQEETRIPIGVPHKQTVIATLPIQSLNIQIGNQHFPSSNEFYQLDYLKDDSLVQIGKLSFKPHSNKRIFDIIFPVTGAQNQNRVIVKLRARSGSENAERSWPVNVMGLKFASWPPIKPKKWTAPEETLYNQFIRRFPTQESYLSATVSERQRYPLTYEAREVSVVPHFQNVDFGTYRNYRISFPQSSVPEILRSGTGMHKEVENLPRDINQLVLTVETDYGSNAITFFVKRVGTALEPDMIERCDVRYSGGSGIYTIYIECLNYFGERVMIDKNNVRFEPSRAWRSVGDNLIEIEGDISGVRMYFSIPLVYHDRFKPWQHQFE